MCLFKLKLNDFVFNLRLKTKAKGYKFNFQNLSVILIEEKKLLLSTVIIIKALVKYS